MSNMNKSNELNFLGEALALFKTEKGSLWKLQSNWPETNILLINGYQCFLLLWGIHWRNTRSPPRQKNVICPPFPHHISIQLSFLAALRQTAMLMNCLRRSLGLCCPCMCSTMGPGRGDSNSRAVAVFIIVVVYVRIRLLSYCNVAVCSRPGLFHLCPWLFLKSFPLLLASFLLKMH